MFERTFSFWRRAKAKPAPLADDKLERRLWVRYPANVTANVTRAQGDERKLNARVRDISLGGANLLVEQAFKPGDLLSIHLPAGPERDINVVLACVVRATEEGPGKFALGCVFSRELTDEDLEGFGARRLRHSPADNRIYKRFPCDFRARFQQVASGETDFLEARVLNLSATGIGLEIDYPLEAGSLLNVDLLGKNGQPMRTILSCVVHVTHRAGGSWAVGCNFIRELDEDDLQSLL